MHSYHVEVRIVGENLDLDDISSRLNLRPTQTRKKGEHKSDTSTWTKDMWSLEVLPPTGNAWDSLEMALRALLGKIASHRDVIQSLGGAEGIVIWCGHFASSFNGGPSLSPDLLGMLGNFGAQLVIDTYCDRLHSTD